MWANWDFLKLGNFLWVAPLAGAVYSKDSHRCLPGAKPSLPQAGPWDGDGKPEDLIFGPCFIQMWTTGTVTTPITLPSPERVGVSHRLVSESKQATAPTAPLYVTLEDRAQDLGILIRLLWLSFCGVMDLSFSLPGFSSKSQFRRWRWRKSGISSKKYHAASSSSVLRE